MSQNHEELNRLKHLGSGKTDYPKEYAPQVLEAIRNEFRRISYVVELKCPEFTTLCPKTSQPDFANITIKYVPDEFLVESKSLKLYLCSFRNHGAFHESCINMIAQDLFELLFEATFFHEVEFQLTPAFGLKEVNLLLTFHKLFLRWFLEVKIRLIFS